MVKPDELPKSELGFVKHQMHLGVHIDAWKASVSHIILDSASQAMYVKKCEKHFPAVSEAGQELFPKCKEGTEGHRS